LAQSAAQESDVFKLAHSPASTPIAVQVAARLQRTAEIGAARLFLATGVLLALAAAALAIDLPLARFLDRVEIAYDLRHFLRLGEVFGWGGTAALIMLSAATLDRRGWRVIPRLVVTAFGSGLLANGIKLLIARTRPLALDLNEPVAETFQGWRPALYDVSLTALHDENVQSFPSAHSATAAGLAIGLAVICPRGRWLFAALAAMTALQRLEVGAHFLSDVLAGAAIGCLVGGLCQLNFGLGKLFVHLERK
jgi:membrane-associated phospholipid phosphatase